MSEYWNILVTNHEANSDEEDEFDDGFESLENQSNEKDKNADDQVDKDEEQKGFFKDQVFSYTENKSPKLLFNDIQSNPEIRNKRRNSGDKTLKSIDISQGKTVYNLLNTNFDQDLYERFKYTAYQERETHPPGNSPFLNSLFCFWCYHLRDVDKRDMYEEFLKVAVEEAEKGFHYGIECYFRMCSYGLELRFDEKIFADFQRYAILDYNRGSKYGLEKLKYFIDHKKYTVELQILPEIHQLFIQFPTIESLSDNSASKKRSLFAHAPGGSSVPKDRSNHWSNRDSQFRYGRGGRGKRGGFDGRGGKKNFGFDAFPTSLPQRSPLNDDLS